MPLSARKGLPHLNNSGVAAPISRFYDADLTFQLSDHPSGPAGALLVSTAYRTLLRHASGTS
jgi:hypothetical protein